MAAGDFRGNTRRLIAGLVGQQEDWTDAQRATPLEERKSLPDKLWNSKYKFSYGFVGLKTLTPEEAVWNITQSEWLLTPDIWPFIHQVKNVS